MHKILAIETSCDETAAAVVENTTILSSVKFTQTSHAEFGGVVPSLARRDHEDRIDEIINLAISKSQIPISKIDAIAVTAGPGLAIALEVGIKHAKELAKKWGKPLLAVNHIEGHVLSGLTPEVQFPAMALVVSGGHTELIWVEKVGQYKIVARTMDDALGEALDKAARMLGLGYPGGAELEKRAALGNPKKYLLPLPMARSKILAFSYSGLKTAFARLVQKVGTENINDLAATFQNRAFEHLTRVITKSITSPSVPLLRRSHELARSLGEGSQEKGVLLVGGGVIANQELRKRLEKLGGELGLQVHFAPMELTGDNAAMIGIAAGFKAERGEFADPDKVDRLPRWRVDE